MKVCSATRCAGSCYLDAGTAPRNVTPRGRRKGSITGNGAWKGRALQACVALQWGQYIPLPNVSMALGGYNERGTDVSLPPSVHPETMTNQGLWPLNRNGQRGILGAPPADVIALARTAPSEVDSISVFGRTFAGSKALSRWRTRRDASLGLETQDLIT